MWKQAIKSGVNLGELPKMVTRSYGGLPTLWRYVSLWPSSGGLFAVTACTARLVDSRWVLEGVFELDGEVHRRLGLLDITEILHVPGDRGVTAGLVDCLGIVVGVVWPGTGTIRGGVGERVWVVDGEGHGDVAIRDAVDDEVGDLEGVAREHLVLDLQLTRQSRSSGGDEGNAHGDGVDELHGDELVGWQLFGVCADRLMFVEVVCLCER